MTLSKQADLQSTPTPSAVGSHVSILVGTIVATVAKTLPHGWLSCNGSTIPSACSELIQLLGSSVTPNLVGRTLIGAGTLSTSNAVQADGTTPNFAFPSSLSILPSGYTGGEYEHTLSASEMPCHQHFGWGDIDGSSGGNGDTSPWGFGRSNGDANWFGSNGNDTDNYLYGSTFAGGVLNSDGSTNQIPTSSGSAGTAMTNTAAHLTMQPYYAVNYIIFAGQL